MKRRSNIEIVDYKAKRKTTHYSAGDVRRKKSMNNYRGDTSYWRVKLVLKSK